MQQPHAEKWARLLLRSRQPYGALAFKRLSRTRLRNPAGTRRSYIKRRLAAGQTCGSACAISHGSAHQRLDPTGGTAGATTGEAGLLVTSPRQGFAAGATTGEAGLLVAFPRQNKEKRLRGVLCACLALTLVAVNGYNAKVRFQKPRVAV